LRNSTTIFSFFSNYRQNQLSPIEDEDISVELRSLIEQRLPDLCILDGEPIQFTAGENKSFE
jgi:hypothetical protein